MRWLRRLQAQLLPLSWGALLFLLGFLPLLGGPRYEAALLAGVIGPFWLSWDCALLSFAAAGQRLALPQSTKGVQEASLLLNALARGLKRGILYLLLLLGVSAFHGLRAGFCEPEAGFALFVLGPGVGLLFTALLSSLLSAAGYELGGQPSSNWKRVLSLLALGNAVPLFFVCIALLEFYFTPAVYLYSQLAGYFAGPIYETVEYPTTNLLTYRLGTLCTALGLVSALFALRDRAGRRLGGALSGLFFVASFTLALHGSALGHRSSTQSVRAALPQTVTQGPCEVWFSPLSTRAPDAQLLAEECQAHLKQIAHYFDLTPPTSVRVFLFAQDEHKKRHIGVAQTYIAKPWRREIYLQEAGYPHPILGHELAHIALGAWGRGPFHVAGKAVGLWPDPGRIEGFAVAAVPTENSDASLAEWARAMLELKRLPPVTSLFQVGFFLESAARSYTAAGAFVDFIRTKYGTQVLREWYSGSSLPALTGRTWSELQQDFHQSLLGAEPAEEVLAEAAQRFSSSAVFERRCPHLVDRLKQTAYQSCSINPQLTDELVGQALQLDPGQQELLPWSASCFLAQGETHSAQTGLRRLAQTENLPPWVQLRQRITQGDLHWLQGEASLARQEYEHARQQSPARASQRLLEVRLWALEQEEYVQSIVQEILIGPRTPGASSQAARLLGQWLERAPQEPMAYYLAAKNVQTTGAIEPALRWIEQAVRLGLPTENLLREALRTWLLLAARAHNEPALRAAYEHMVQHHLPPARLREAERIADRAGLSLGLSL